MSTIKVAIAEDQDLFRHGLVNLLNSFPRVEVMLAVENGQVLLESLENNRPDVVILDYRMPVMGGLITAINIRKRFPKTRILILSMYDDEEFIIKSIDNGAHGYLSKDDHPDQIRDAIYSVMDTGYYLNDRTSKYLIKKLMQEGKVIPKFAKENIEFSQTELDVIELICQEHTNQEIADLLAKSKRTIESTRTQIMEKIGARNVVGIVMYAIKNELVKVD